MIRLENVLKISLQDVLKTSWRCLEDVFQDVLKTFWRRLEDVLRAFSKRLEDVLKTFLHDVLKTSWRLPENVLKTSWRRPENVLKTFWRRTAKPNILVLTKMSSEDVRLRRAYSSWSRHLEDVFKTSSEDEDERHLQVVFKTSSSKQMFAGLKCKRKEAPFLWLCSNVLMQLLGYLIFVWL